MAYNDPSLGEQVISASEFERLWELQGNSGVAVATEPPVEVADPGVLALWVAFAAGLMALVSTTPLVKLRQGIGGMLDAGPGSYTSSRSAPKPAPRSDPAEKEKEKKPKKASARFDDEIAVVSTPPKATKPRFDDEPPPPPKPTSSVVVTPSELKAATVSPATTPAYPRARFDEEEEPKPKPTPAPVATPSEPQAAATATPSSSIQRNASVGMSYAPSAATQVTPLLTLTPGAQTYADRGGNLPPLPDMYRQYLPTLTLPEWDYRTPSIELGLLEFGTQDAFHMGVPANPDLRMTPTKGVFDLGLASVKIGWALSTIEVAIRTPAKEYDVDGLGTTAKVQQSGSLSLTWSGWNTTTRAAYNPVDIRLSGPDDREAIYGSGNHGVYVEQKPVQELAVLAIAGAALTIGALVYAGSGGMVGNLGSGLENVLAH